MRKGSRLSKRPKNAVPARYISASSALDLWRCAVGSTTFFDVSLALSGEIPEAERALRFHLIAHGIEKVGVGYVVIEHRHYCAFDHLGRFSHKSTKATVNAGAGAASSSSPNAEGGRYPIMP